MTQNENNGVKERRATCLMKGRWLQKRRSWLTRVKVHFSVFISRGLTWSRHYSLWPTQRHLSLYRQHDKKQYPPRTLPILKLLLLILLILQHVLSKGLQRVRDYGLLSSAAKKLRLVIQLLLLPAHDWLTPTKKITSPRAIRLCPCCQHEMHCIGTTRKS